MTAAKPTFATGDVVTLKGQSAIMTVVPEPHNAISKDGWVWCVQTHSAGTCFNLLPVDALVKTPPQRRAK